VCSAISEHRTGTEITERERERDGEDVYTKQNSQVIQLLHWVLSTNSKMEEVQQMVA